MEYISEEALDRLLDLSMRADPPPWRSMVEGRDHMSGDSFIQIGADGDRREDMYVSRDSGPAIAVDLDFIAAVRNLLPALICEIRERRGAEVPRDSVEGSGSS